MTASLKEYKILTYISAVLLIASIVLYFIFMFQNQRSLALILISGISLCLSVGVSLVNFIKNSHLDSPNPIRFAQIMAEYFDKVGYGMFSGGIVAFATTTQKNISIGIIIIGFSCVIIAVLNKNKVEKFQKDIKSKSMNHKIRKINSKNI
jgi:hypothetical protein